MNNYCNNNKFASNLLKKQSGNEKHQHLHEKMDKYTVDLDQLLNDFEYSELTDQHLRKVPERQQHSIPFQPAPVMKHSINNVFHSLNEYLNSEINSGGGSALDTDNKLTDNSLTTTSKSQEEDESRGNNVDPKMHQEFDSSDITQDNSSSQGSVALNYVHNEITDNGHEEIKIKNVDCIIKTEVSDYSLVVTEEVTDAKIENDIVPHLVGSATIGSNFNNKLECDSNANLKADSSLVEDNSNINNAEKLDSLEKETEGEVLNCDSDNILSDNQDHQEGILVDLQEYLPVGEGVKCENDQELSLDHSETTEPPLESNNQVQLEDNPLVEEGSQTKTTDELNQTVEELIDAPVIEPTENKSPELIETSEDKPDIDSSNVLDIAPSDAPDKDNDQLVSRVKNSELHEEVQVHDQETSEKAQHVVGFSTDIDIDENELNKMLEDLELEANEEFESSKGDSDAEGHVVKSIETETVKTEDQNREIIESQETVTDGQENSAADNNDSPKENSEKVEPVEQVIECLEIEKLALPRTRRSEAVQEEEVVSEKQVKEETLAPERESVSRPQDLPLNNQTEETTGRKIDLIGSPGSTPYNNVYINKSIDPKPVADTESDYASSASPTFSDCSTGSTGTASTASIEEVANAAASRFTSKNLKVDKNQTRETAIVEERVEENVQEAGDGAAVGGDSQEANENPGIVDNSGDSGAVNSENQSSGTFLDKSWLGKQAPLWIPDADAASCLHCDMKFTVLKRRHHCRACGLVLCAKCCNLKFRLEYLDSEVRVCNKCYDILNKNTPNNAGADQSSDSGNSPAFRPNPNNPLEYCSTVSPLQQAGQVGAPPPSVMVPVGVLKRQGSSKKSNKSVMFCDGIAPGSDLTNLDQDFNYSAESGKVNKSPVKQKEEAKKDSEPPPAAAVVPTAKIGRNQPKVDEETGCFIPKSETSLPPSISVNKTDILYSDCSNSPSVVEMLKNETLVFALTQNLFVHVKLINMTCCINKQAWCFTSEGLINVGSDEVVYLIEYIDEESFVPKDMFYHVYNLYLDAVKGTSIKELGLSLHNTFNFLDSRNHAGFVYIKPTFQCLENLIVPQEPFLIGILIHRWETPWAKLLPLRLILRLGAEYRYYPSPLISTRHRDSVFVEIGHTIINLLADFRNFTYTLPQIRGLIIHMEDKKTTIHIPKNRYELVMKCINNSSEHILAFAGNFSREADSHLVCIQDTQTHDNCYSTHAINIHNKPRKVTGASFIVFNGSLKSSSGLTAKSNIVEDGLMIQIPSEHMEKIRDNLRNMKDHTIACGCINAASDESVNIVWGVDDVDFNSGVKSPVDLKDMKGVPSIRVHNGQDFFCSSKARLIRWTEVFIVQNVEDNPRNRDPVDISKVSESIAKACCTALVKYLDLLISNSCQKIGIRATLHVEQVSYLAGSNGSKLAPIYMRSLDNELIPVLHRITSNNLGDNSIVLELVFRILNG